MEIQYWPMRNMRADYLEADSDSEGANTINVYDNILFCVFDFPAILRLTSIS